jgi:hypothetical protein
MRKPPAEEAKRASKRCKADGLAEKKMNWRQHENDTETELGGPDNGRCPA